MPKPQMLMTSVDNRGIGIFLCVEIRDITS